MGSAKKTVSYRYDANRNRTLMIDPDGGRTTYVYDPLNRITSLINPQGERTTYAYDAKGRRTVKKLANGTRASFTYDAANRLTTLANLKSDNTVISKFDYKYDNVGNRTEVAEADGSRVTWSYDDNYQLTGEHRTGTTPYRNTFTYDSVGNRLLKNESGARTTYSYDAANQLKTSIDANGTTTYTYDADGNQERVQAPTGDRTTTTWDYENKTTLVELPSGIRNTMAYEPDGLRVKLEDSTGTKKFIWDDQNYLAESDENNDINVVYTNEPNYYGNLISQRRSSATNWYHYEALGSTRELTDATEATTDTYLYDAWGNLLSSTGTTPNPFQFTGNVGYYFDTDTGNQYIRARIYSPIIGRWWSVDPLGVNVVLNLFAADFVPVMIDPSGTKCQPPKSNQSYTLVRGRGDFVNSLLGAYEPPSIRNKIGQSRGSNFATRWSFAPETFVDPTGVHGCCCSKIGFIQVVRDEMKGTSAFNRDWRIDAGIPYPNKGPLGDVTADPCLPLSRKAGTSISMTDSPSFPVSQYNFNFATQVFQTCVVCLEGCEGPLAGGNGYVVYGCLDWGFEVNIKRGSGRAGAGRLEYKIKRWIDSLSEESSWGKWDAVNNLPELQLLLRKTGGTAPLAEVDIVIRNNL